MISSLEPEISAAIIEVTMSSSCSGVFTILFDSVFPPAQDIAGSLVHRQSTTYNPLNQLNLLNMLKANFNNEKVPQPNHFTTTDTTGCILKQRRI